MLLAVIGTSLSSARLSRPATTSGFASMTSTPRIPVSRLPSIFLHSYLY